MPAVPGPAITRRTRINIGITDAATQLASLLLDRRMGSTEERSRIVRFEPLSPFRTDVSLISRATESGNADHSCAQFNLNRVST